MPAYQYVYVMKGLDRSLSRRARGVEGHHAVLLPRRQDRRARRQRLRQVDAAEDHGRARHTTSAARPGRRRAPSVGYLPQEPQLDPEQDGAGERDARRCADLKALLDRFNEISATLRRAARRRRDGRAAGGAGRAAGEDRRRGRLGAGPHASRSPWTRCAARPATPIATLSGGERRRVALCRLLLEKPGPAAAGRADQPPRRRKRRLAGAHLQDYAGTVMVVTHDRYFLDNVTGWILELDRGRGIPCEGNYSSWLEQKQQAARAGGEAGERPGSARWRASWSGSRASPRARQAKNRRRASSATRSCYAQSLEQAPGAARDRHPARPAPRRRWSSRPKDLRKGYGDRLLIEDLELPAAARRHRRRDRPERRRQDDAVPHDHRPGAAGRGRDPRSARR